MPNHLIGYYKCKFFFSIFLHELYQSNQVHLFNSILKKWESSINNYSPKKLLKSELHRNSIGVDRRQLEGNKSFPELSLDSSSQIMRSWMARKNVRQLDGGHQLHSLVLPGASEVLPRSFSCPAEGGRVRRQAIVVAGGSAWDLTALKHVTVSPHLSEEVLGELAGPNLDLVRQGGGSSGAWTGLGAKGSWPHWVIILIKQSLN